MPIYSVTFLISCCTIRLKELLVDVLLYNMLIEGVLPQSAPSGLVLMLQGTILSLLPTTVSGATKLHVQDHRFKSVFLKSLPGTSMFS